MVSTRPNALIRDADRRLFINPLGAETFPVVSVATVLLIGRVHTCRSHSRGVGRAKRFELKRVHCRSGAFLYGPSFHSNGSLRSKSYVSMQSGSWLPVGQHAIAAVGQCAFGYHICYADVGTSINNTAPANGAPQSELLGIGGINCYRP